jgi:hypothetical protein
MAAAMEDRISDITSALISVTVARAVPGVEL